MAYIARDIIERDCKDFRGINKPGLEHCCKFSPTCKIKEQDMFSDVIDGRPWCVGISDAAKSSSVLLKEACRGRKVTKADDNNYL